MLKISIIISCYNRADFIQKCVESALLQTYTNIEVIVINDASTDNSLSILGQLTDERLKVISHTTNMGAGIARKTGIENATGDYIFFLDSDDYIDKSMIEILLNSAKEYDSIDIICSGAIFEYPDGHTLEYRYHDYLASSPSDKYNFYKNEKLYLNGRFFKRSLFEKIPYSDLPFFEDVATYIPLLMEAKNVLSSSYLGYHYTMNPNSLTHTASQAKALVFMTLVKITHYNTLVQYNLVSNNLIYEIIMKYMLSFRKYRNEILQEYPEWHQKILEISASLPSNNKSH